MSDSAMTAKGGQNKRKTWIPQCVALLVAVLAIATDQVTKHFALIYLADGREEPLLGNILSLRLIRNPGAAFSLGAGKAWIFTIVSIVVVVVIIWELIRISDVLTGGLFGLLAGGAIGNLIDRFIEPPGMGQGHVVDFINYFGLFIGNVADVWIVLSVVCIVLLVLMGRIEIPGMTTSDSKNGASTEHPSQTNLTEE